MQPTILFDNGTVQLAHYAPYQGSPAYYCVTIQTPAGPSQTTIPDPAG